MNKAETQKTLTQTEAQSKQPVGLGFTRSGQDNRIQTSDTCETRDFLLLPDNVRIVGK